MWVYLFAGLMLLMSCSSSSNSSNTSTAYLEKMDAPLKRELAESENRDVAKPVHIIGKCNQAIDEVMRRQLEESGVTVRSVTGQIFTASGSVLQIEKLAGLDIVSQLQLSVERNIQ